ncbi:G3E family GTPase [Natranaerovirga hydrolytica]|uniref:G3E family GTPase n=1 Tax=Natranaerovirga hydrolytica TaxID=680378 RepID=A0A4R1MYU8_9FIRM|nr:GTP-binding protein [Natranaerovirga hydrolytica]TCK97780.1 G3E family GTPase [Natranaerovirga hydrolytica]
MKVDIISGFLGAGKTSFIIKLLKEAFKNEKIVIIENEYGEIGIDGTLLKEYTMNIKELYSGCICCSVVGDFVTALDEIMNDYKPDRIIVEPSGVAKLSDIKRACEQSKYWRDMELNMIVTMLDATKYNIHIKNFGEFFNDQIKCGKTIVLTRIEQLSLEEKDHLIKEIQEKNSNANIISKPLEEINGEEIIEVGEKPAVKTDVIRKVENHQHHHEHHHHHTAEDVFEKWETLTHKAYEEDEIKNILMALDKKIAGNVLRGKGIVKHKVSGWLQFSYVHNEHHITPIKEQKQGQVYIVGHGLKEEQLKTFFAS